ncbi:uncharacterized protein LOC134274032 [Saccostrea cucullata]|uniref:uncharacterized protein LOC134274032 n=1 Tax=Saccostrea cuccullata TaxID=36930 RepID=UPI002ED588CE
MNNSPKNWQDYFVMPVRICNSRRKLSRVICGTCRGRFLLACVIIVGLTYINMLIYMPVFQVFRNKNIHAPCLLPVFDMYDKSINDQFWSQQPLPCENWLDLFFVSPLGNLTLNQTAVQLSGLRNIRCHYRYIIRKSETKFVFSEKLEYISPKYLDGDFVHVECFDNQNKRVYNNLHFNVDAKPILKSRKLVNESLDKLSVIAFGLDSVSRLIAERKLPKTMKYLRQSLGAYVFAGHTRLGDSSFPNLNPLLTGLISDYTTPVPPVHELPFIFKNFSDQGAVNVFVEDWYEVATFKGFTDPPTMHYSQPLIQAMDQVRPSYLAIDKSFQFLQSHNIPLRKVSALCFGNEKRYKILMNYYKRFIEKYGNTRKFAFSWINELAHDFFNMVELADEDILNLFKWLKESGKLENAVLLFFSDHGPRYSEIQNTDIGRVSNLLPLMSIVLPKRLTEKYPHIAHNMKMNTERLTTNHDVFLMLKDILYANYEEQPVVKPDENGMLPYEISLFREIPPSRSCADARISDVFCPCYTSVRVSNSDERIIQSAHIVVDRINDILKKVQTKCAKVKFVSIHHASLIFPDMQRDLSQERAFSLRGYFLKVKSSTRFLISFSTEPGNALFEARVDYKDPGDIKILGNILRTNAYGNQSSCIAHADRIRRLYCYCI